MYSPNGGFPIAKIKSYFQQTHDNDTYDYQNDGKTWYWTIMDIGMWLDYIYIYIYMRTKLFVKFNAMHN